MRFIKRLLRVIMDAVSTGSEADFAFQSPPQQSRVLALKHVRDKYSPQMPSSTMRNEDCDFAGLPSSLFGQLDQIWKPRLPEAISK